VSAADRQVVVDRKTCVGSSYCINIAKGAFAIDRADGKVRVVDTGAASIEDLQDAVDTCPVGAISFAGDVE
jgi:ferredoxin